MSVEVGASFDSAADGFGCCETIVTAASASSAGAGMISEAVHPTLEDSSSSSEDTSRLLLAVPDQLRSDDSSSALCVLLCVCSVVWCFVVLCDVLLGFVVLCGVMWCFIPVSPFDGLIAVSRFWGLIAVSRFWGLIAMSRFWGLIAVSRSRGLIAVAVALAVAVPVAATDDTTSRIFEPLQFWRKTSQARLKSPLVLGVCHQTRHRALHGLAQPVSPRPARCYSACVTVPCTVLLSLCHCALHGVTKRRQPWRIPQSSQRPHLVNSRRAAPKPKTS